MAAQGVCTGDGGKKQNSPDKEIQAVRGKAGCGAVAFIFRENEPAFLAGQR